MTSKAALFARAQQKMAGESKGLLYARGDDDLLGRAVHSA